MTNQIMELADAYAEHRHVHGAPQYNAVSASARAALQAEVEKQDQEIERLHDEVKQMECDDVGLLRAENEQLREVLRFYADKEHFVLSDDTAWDTVSGEPQNYWCDEASTATVEDGANARAALEQSK